MTQEPNNNRIAEVRASLTAACPRESDRLIALRQLATSADTAGEIAPNAWAVSLLPDGFRLNVGQVEALVLVSGLVRVNLVGTYGLPPFVGSKFQQTKYKSIPGPQCAYVGSLSSYAKVASDLDAAHRAFLDQAARAPSGAPRKGTSFSRRHCEELIQYARSHVHRAA